MKKLTDKTCFTFKGLLSRFEFEDIRTAFVSLWKADCPDKAEQLDLEGWKEIYDKCREIEPAVSEYYIYLGSRWEHCCPMIDMNCRILDKSNDGLCGPLAWHPSWSELIGMEIAVNEDVDISLEELAAGLFWEITYYGGNEQEAERNRKSLLQSPRPILVFDNRSAGPESGMTPECINPPALPAVP